ncbi:DUF1735 domain-containing protein [Bacteroides ovatus]|uniref:DUF1735 domain-containing protein n=1 Tax=Bacteroides ovatus TaxID=28116 RepID=UPI0039B46F63
MRLKNIIWKTVVMSLMASPLCISCDDDDEVTVNSKFYLSTKVFPVDSYEASLSVILKDNSVVVNELQPNYRFVACATERLSKDVKITADSDDNLVSAYNKANDTEYNILPAENYSFTNKTVTIEKSGTQYIKFSKAVETRYLKYYVKQGPNTVSLTEFDLYAK